MFLADYITNFFKYGVLGNSLRIDASNACQLRCPTCHQVKEGEHSFRRMHLKFDDFRKFVDQHPTFKNIELADNGEIFLNPDLEKIFQYAFTKKIDLTARDGVNLNDASEMALEYMVKFKVRLVLVSIDGASPETYRIFRQKGDFQRVIENIEIINRYKRHYGSKFPVLVWQFIVFGHNEHEIPLARSMAKKLNMRFFLKFNADPSYSPVKNKELVRKEMGYSSMTEYEDITKTVYAFSCHQLWRAPQIGPQGDLLGCCYNNRENAFGNVFELGLEKVLKSERFIYAKKMLLGQKNAREDIPCINCSVYKNMRARRINIMFAFFSLLRRLKNTHL